jgi:hypothetical protein
MTVAPYQGIKLCFRRSLHIEQPAYGIYTAGHNLGSTAAQHGIIKTLR